jgi:hypothetical protein
VYTAGDLHPATVAVTDAHVRIILGLTIGVMVAVAAGGVFWLSTNQAKVESTHNLQVAMIEQCRTDQAANAYRLLIGRDQKLARRLFPLLNCEATVAACGREARPAEVQCRVPLSRGEARRYMAIVKRGRLPIVRSGKIVGSQAPPHPPQQVAR